MSSRTFVMGDIHGAYKALKQCLERSKFDYDNDVLIQLGDVCDGWSETYECIEELLNIHHLIPIRGNHDDWFRDFLQYGEHFGKWEQGGLGTATSYINFLNKGQSVRINRIMPKMSGFIVQLTPDEIPPLHRNFFLDEQMNYYRDEEDNLFIHAGFDRRVDIERQEEYLYWWNRDLWNQALSFESMTKGCSPTKFRTVNDFKEIFIGHTPTTCWNKTVPMKAGNVWNLDTGAGGKGKLTIMDIDTKEYWQSDFVKELYPDERGR